MNVPRNFIASAPRWIRLGFPILAGVLCLFSRNGVFGSETASGVDKPTVVIVTGAAGEPAYGTNFLQQASLWDAAARTAGLKSTWIGTDPTAPGDPEDRERLESTLSQLPREGEAPVWLILIGHGTYDGKEARFNLRGPDVSDADLAGWLAPIQRPMILINTASASAPFLQKLSRTNRIVISATRSGHEQNVTRFGKFLTLSLTDPATDLDADGQNSVFELFLATSRKVADSYRDDGRLLTEHALLDDNGDGLGTPADWFRGLHPIRKPKDGKVLDGRRAHQVHLLPSAEESRWSAADRARRDALELRLYQLRDRKPDMAAAAYEQELEKLLLELAVLYRDAGGAQR